MDLTRLSAILTEATVLLPNGAAVDERGEAPVRVTDVFAMPHEADAARKLEGVHLDLAIVGVDKAVAERRREELLGVLRDYPRPDRLASGPSYIEVGAEIGDQGAALRLFALGKALGLWDVVTPAGLGFTGEEARQIAGAGLVMMTGFKP